VTEQADVLVIGGGMAGAAVAAELAGGDRRIIVLERESQAGLHATGRSAAVFSETYGGRAVRALTRASRAFYLAPPTGFADHALVTPRGSMHIANADTLAALVRFAGLPDVAAVTRPLTAAETAALCPILRPEQALGGLLEPEARDIEVHGLHYAYLRKLRQCGGQLRLDAAVLSLSRATGVWRAETAAGTFEAPVIVNAAGAWAGEVAKLAGATSIEIEPRRRTAVLVDPPADVDVRGWPFVIDTAESFYFKPDAGKLLLSAADETLSPPCDAQAEEIDVAIAIDRVQTATTLDVRRVKHRWAGLRTFVRDRAPVIGFDPKADGFFWLAALGGYGIQTAPAVGRLAADLIKTGRMNARLEDAGLAMSDLSVARLALSEAQQTPPRGGAVVYTQSAQLCG